MNENSFSEPGGYRGLYGIHNYDGLGYCDYAENDYVMSVLHVVGVRRGRAQHLKQEWDHRFHEPRMHGRDLEELLKQHPEVAKKLRSWNAGCTDASVLAKKVGLKDGISNADWMDPWAATAEY